MVDNNPPYNKRNIGTRYENIAVEYLLSQGHTIIKRNYRTRLGEIDIISKIIQQLYLQNVNIEAITDMDMR